jgi:hypothetical protein
MSGLSRQLFSGLYSFCSFRRIPVQTVELPSAGAVAAAVYRAAEKGMEENQNSNARSSFSCPVM